MQTLMRNLLLTLAVLAVASGQVFGMHRGYTCDHRAVVFETQSEHCHSVVSQGISKSLPCDESLVAACESGDQKEVHQPLEVNLQVTPSSLAALSIPVFVAVLVADFSFLNWPAFWVLVEDTNVKGLSFENERPSLPSAAIQVAQCIVILV